MSTTSRHYCFTEYQKSPKQDWDKMRYMVFQIETCPKSGRPHLQGYIELYDPLRITGVKKGLEIQAHVEERRGSRDQARHYCMKPVPDCNCDDCSGKSGKGLRNPGPQSEVGPWEFGTWIEGQGDRTDLKDFIALIKEGHSTDMIVYENTAALKFVKHLREYENIHLDLTLPNFRSVEVIVLWGLAGMGKTKAAFELDPQIYSVPAGSPDRAWFDRYRGQNTILIDDFYGSWPYDFLLKVLDGYKIQVPFKGGHVWARWTRVIITSNNCPCRWYPQGPTPALMRRISQIRAFGTKCHEVAGGNTVPPPQHPGTCCALPSNAPIPKIPGSN